MNSKFEIIKHSGNLPFSIFLHESNRIYPMNWHKEIEILFVLKGSVRVKIRDVSYTVNKDNIILINSYEMHEITPLREDIVILVFQLDPYFYQKYYQGFTEIIFHMNSTTLNKDTNTYNTIKENLVIMMWYRLNKENTYQIKLLKQSLALVELLLRNFKKTMVYDRSHNDRSQRLISIIEYINKNYNKKLTLSTIAEQEYISIHYLSKFFKNRVGIGFNKYLNLFRLNKSMNDLLNSNKMILEIALDHGFSSVKAYTMLFKETYKETPSSFRKKYLSDISPKKKTTSITNNSRTILHNYIQLHAKDFLSQNLNQVYYLNINMLQRDNISINKENILQYDFLYDGLNSYIKDRLQTIVDDIQIDYIRFKGIFNKNMSFMNDDHIFNWFYIDHLLESLLTIGIKPFIQLSYSEKKFTMKQWYLLLVSFINHCIEKYGAHEVSTWKLEFGCEEKSNDKFVNLYTLVLKKLCKTYNELYLGISLAIEDSGAENLLSLLNTSYISFVTIIVNDDYYWNNADYVNPIINRLNKNDLKVYFIVNNAINELYDTCFIASYFIYNSLHTYKNVSRVVPFIDAMKGSKIFNGGDSLLTYNGLKKPIYNAYYLLNKLDGEIISQGDYYIAIKNNDRYYILLYYYNKDLGEIFNNQKNSLTYNKFSEQINNSISTIIYLNLKLSEGEYMVRTQVMNEENGCIFSEWMNMGAPDKLSKEDVRFLRSKESMRIRISTINTRDSLHLESGVRQNEVKLIEIKKR